MRWRQSLSVQLNMRTKLTIRYHEYMKHFALVLATLMLSWGSPVTAETFMGRTIHLQEMPLRTGQATVNLNFVLPEKHTFNREAPLRLTWRPSRLVRWENKPDSIKPDTLKFPLQLQAQTRAGRTVLVFEGDFYFCPERSTVCYIDKVQVHQPVRLIRQGPAQLTIKVPLQTGN